MQGEPTLFDGTDGFVNRPASRERAVRESKDGTRDQRHKKVLKYLDLLGSSGATWRELSEHFGLHHGQISSVLSNLHKQGEVFALRIQRDRCHPYVHSKYKPQYDPIDRYDEPVRTSASLRGVAMEHLLSVCKELVSDYPSRSSLSIVMMLKDAVEGVEKHGK